jgi:dTMP kinase
MIIVFEGIDGSGKTTVSKLLAKKLNFTWTKEPTFTSEKADSLNKEKDIPKREVEFLIDRIKHQDILNKNENIICDRYIWSGLSYCKVYNPTSYDFIKILYQHSYFRKPDLYIFIDTPIEVCLQRQELRSNSKVLTTDDIVKLTILRRSYLDTKELIGSKIEFIDGALDIDTIISNCTKLVKDIGK